CKAHQARSYQGQENLAKWFAQNSLERVLAVTGAATCSDRSQTDEASYNHKHQSPRRIADPSRPFQPGSLPRALCLHWSEPSAGWKERALTGSRVPARGAQTRGRAVTPSGMTSAAATSLTLPGARSRSSPERRGWRSQTADHFLAVGNANPRIAQSAE